MMINEPDAEYQQNCIRMYSPLAYRPSFPVPAKALLDTDYNSIMNKSKFRRSLVKFNQNNSEVSQHLSFLPLLTLPSGQPRMHAEGLSVIEEQPSGRTFLVAVVGRSRGLINALYRNNNLLQE